MEDEQTSRIGFALLVRLSHRANFRSQRKPWTAPCATAADHRPQVGRSCRICRVSLHLQGGGWLERGDHALGTINDVARELANIQIKRHQQHDPAGRLRIAREALGQRTTKEVARFWQV
jgi:hypothetical protein